MRLRSFRIGVLLGLLIVGLTFIPVGHGVKVRTFGAVIIIGGGNGVRVVVNPSSGTFNLFLNTAANGGTTTCVRSASLITYAVAIAASPTNVCSTWNKAYETASDGDTIGVKNAVYPSDGTLGGASRYLDSATVHATPVTFKCADAGTETVTVTDRNFYITAADGLTIQGGCFQFKLMDVGEGSNSGTVAQNITADGVRMESFGMSGASNITIKNSNIGPSVDCYATSDLGQPAASRCQAGQVWPESWYYANGVAATDSSLGNGQAQVRCNLTVCGSGDQLLNNYFHDFQSRDTGSLHPGCLQWQFGGNLNLTMTGNAFERCASQGILFDDNAMNATYSGITMTNNFFGYAVAGFDSGLGCCAEAATAQKDVTLLERIPGAIGVTMSNNLIAYNSFTHGIDLNSQGTAINYSNVRVIGNILGQNTPCRSGAGLTWDRNVYVGAKCGDANAITTFPYTSSSPYATYNEGSVQVEQATPVAGPALGTGVSSFQNWITETTSDYAIGTDYFGLARSTPRTAGAAR